MNMRTVSDTLKRAIEDSGQSLQGLGHETGVNRLCLARFLAGKPISSRSVDVLARYFKLELTPAPAPVRRKRRAD